MTCRHKYRSQTVPIFLNKQKSPLSTDRLNTPTTSIRAMVSSQPKHTSNKYNDPPKNQKILYKSDYFNNNKNFINKYDVLLIRTRFKSNEREQRHPRKPVWRKRQDNIKGTRVNENAGGAGVGINATPLWHSQSTDSSTHCRLDSLGPYTVSRS